MRGSKLGLLAAGVLLAGTAGCSLPEVLPLAGGTTQGPSPYGVWYEQHWATKPWQSTVCRIRPCLRFPASSES